MIIDFHAHTFPPAISIKAIENLSRNGHTAYFTDATAASLSASMRGCGITYTVNLPVMTRPDQVEKVNTSLINSREELLEGGIITFGGIHPDYENCSKELKRLVDSGIKGIKLHPAFQGVHINDIRYKRIIGTASDLGLITVTHSGLDVGFPQENFASVGELLDVINDVRPEKLVLAHMGGWQAWESVESDIAGANVWLDTSYSIGKVYPRPGDEDLMPWKYNLDDEAFTRLVRKHGSQKVLFATDSPWSQQKEYIEIIKNSSLDSEEKAAVLGGNAAKLLDMKL